MRLFKRLFIPLALLVMVGCTSTQYWGKTLPADRTLDSLKTKAEVMAALGGPANIIYGDTGQALVYIHNEGKGGGVAIGTFQPIFEWSREHTGTDTLVFLVDLQERVERYVLLKGTEHINTSIWPFNDVAE